MTDPETLRSYARIFRMPRRFGPGNTIIPPSELSLAAAHALEALAQQVEAYAPEPYRAPEAF